MNFTPKARMLNAYKGVFSDRYPVAPEFWYYYPAKVLGVDMIEFEREVQFWKALQETFKKFGTEGWGVVAAVPQLQGVSDKTSFDKVEEGRYCFTLSTKYKNSEFTTKLLYDKFEPSWVTEYPVKDEADLETYFEIYFQPDIKYDFEAANDSYAQVGEDYLLEMVVGGPFFDAVASALGFEKTIFYFTMASSEELKRLQKLYLDCQIDFIKKACAETKFESFFLGCSFSCNSLLGPVLWRQWDKPCIKAIADELHKHGKYLHIHFHGKCMETVADFSEIGIDSVCPFERPPGGDIEGLQGLKKARELLNGKVAMNGNVHTVETLIRGTTKKVKAEVREIKEAFAGEPRLIIGSGDQVGYETPEENIHAMVEEATIPFDK